MNLMLNMRQVKTMQITNVTCPSSKYSIKCPDETTKDGICVHNTANDASAMSEISYMLGNNNKVSFHAAVDDYRVVTGLPFDRSCYAAGDGRYGGFPALVSVRPSGKYAHVPPGVPLVRKQDLPPGCVAEDGRALKRTQHKLLLYQRRQGTARHQCESFGRNASG